MPSSPDKSSDRQTRTYQRVTSVVFRKTHEPFGGLSNMAAGFPLRVNGLRILTSEALYQSCRFPHRPEVQRLIIEQNSPMTAKMKSKPYRRDSRQDWDQVRVKIMRWCLRVKLAQNWCKFSELLLETGGRPIVEESRKDDFWGAKPADDGTYVGINVLGRLLMELREAIKVEGRESLMRVQPVAIPEFLLNGQSIGVVSGPDGEGDIALVQAVAKPASGEAGERAAMQPSLFDAPVMKEAPAPAYLTISTRGIRIADLKPYAEYKESGLPSVGRVPGHWEVRQARHVGRLLKGIGGTKEDAVAEGMPCVRYGELYTTYTYFIRATRTFIKPERVGGYTPLQYGDVLFAASGETIEDIGKAAVNLMQVPAVCGGDVIVLRPTVAVHAPFLGYAMDCRPATNQKATMARGTTVKHIYPDELRTLLFALPTRAEQAAIVRFLDWANGLLERAIRAKRKVIALLNEQKQAIIHRAVTRGLDPSVPLKPSDIPWLGDIPQHWEVLRSKYVYREIDVRSATGQETHLSMSQRFGLIPSSQIEAKRLVSESYVGAKLCQRGDLVLNRLKAHLGVFALAPEPGVVSPDYTVLRPAREVDERFFEAVYRTPACRVELRQRAKGIVQGFWRLYTDDFYDIRVPVPPVDEQKHVMAQLDIDLSGVNAAISRLEREIELLREYRTRLVADVVTGKLDVRDAATRLPDEAAPDIGEDDSDLSDETEAAYEEAVG